MQKEGKPDEVTWHSRTIPQLLEFAAAGVFLGGTVLYALRGAQEKKEKETSTVDITLPDGSVITQPLIPADYKDQQYYVEEGFVEPPTQGTYNQNLLGQLPGMEGVTWQSGTRPQDRPDYEDQEKNRKPIVIEKVPRVAAPTQQTYNQQLLKQPANLEGVTWKSGTRPQDRPDQG